MEKKCWILVSAWLRITRESETARRWGEPPPGSVCIYGQGARGRLVKAAEPLHAASLNLTTLSGSFRLHALRWCTT